MPVGIDASGVSAENDDFKHYSDCHNIAELSELLFLVNTYCV